MGHIEFEDQQYSQLRQEQPSNTKGNSLADKLVSMGIIREKSKAHLILFVVAILLFIVTYLVLFGSPIQFGQSSQQIYREDLSDEVFRSLPPEVQAEIPSRN